MEGDRIWVASEAGTPGLTPMPHPRRVGQRPAADLMVADIERILQQGEIVSTVQGAQGTEIMKVSDGDVTLEAVFTKRGGRGFYPDAAAYRLDLLLGLDMVPVTVVREVGRSDGSLRFRVPGSVDESQRQETNRGGSAQCPLPDQWEAMPIFDALVFNEGRSLQSIRYSPDTWQLLLTSYHLAFSTRGGRPKFLQGRELKLTGRWRKALEALTDDVLTEHLGDVLDQKRITALAKRRDELLSL
jgi:hypothetical protein